MSGLGTRAVGHQGPEDHKWSVVSVLSVGWRAAMTLFGVPVRGLGSHLLVFLGDQVVYGRENRAWWAWERLCWLPGQTWLDPSWEGLVELLTNYLSSLSPFN